MRQKFWPFPHASILPYDLIPHLKSATQGGNYGSFVATFMISQPKYDSLPESVQAALTKTGELATKNGCQVADEKTGKAAQAIEEGGVKFVTFSDEDMNKIADSMAAFRAAPGSN